MPTRTRLKVSSALAAGVVIGMAVNTNLTATETLVPMVWVQESPWPTTVTMSSQELVADGLQVMRIQEQPCVDAPSSPFTPAKACYGALIDREFCGKKVKIQVFNEAGASQESEEVPSWYPCSCVDRNGDNVVGGADFGLWVMQDASGPGFGAWLRNLGNSCSVLSPYEG